MFGRPHLNLGFTTVRFELFFFIVILLLGLGSIPQNVDSSLTATLLLAWVGIATVSILVHELGHALAYRAFGSRSHIVLHGLGGLTAGTAQPAGRSLVVSLAGPLLPLVLFGLPAWIFRNGDTFPTSIEQYYIVEYVFFINVIWSVLNLLPMLPLDGGNATASIITLVTKRDGMRPTRYVSIVVAAGLGLYALVAWQRIFLGLLAGMIVFLNYRALQGQSGGMPFVGGTADAPGARGARRSPPPVRSGRAAPRRTGPPIRPPAPAGQPSGAPSGVSVGDLLIGGYRALDRREPEVAAQAAKQVLAARPDADVRAAAIELAAWSLLQQAEPARARQALGELPRDHVPNAFLDASLRLAEGDLAGGLDVMAEAFVRVDDAAPRVQGASFVASAGLTRELAEKLVAYPEGVGLVPAMRLQTLLAKLGRDAQAAIVDEVLLGGGPTG